MTSTAHPTRLRWCKSSVDDGVLGRVLCDRLEPCPTHSPGGADQRPDQPAPPATTS